MEVWICRIKLEKQENELVFLQLHALGWPACLCPLFWPLTDKEEQVGGPPSAPSLPSSVGLHRPGLSSCTHSCATGSPASLRSDHMKKKTQNVFVCFHLCRGKGLQYEDWWMQPCTLMASSYSSETKQTNSKSLSQLTNNKTVSLYLLTVKSLTA